MSAARTRPLALYVHWPWCESKCPYCDFNSHAAPPDGEAWRDALIREMETEARQLDLSGRTLTSIFFGGGTPGLMSPVTTAAVIERAAHVFSFAPDIEITLEANPSSVERDRFRAFRAAGVNRVSLGVQSFDDDALAFLGRAHDGAEARTAIEAAADLFDRFSFDLIYARPNQTEAAWAAELAVALGYGPRHLSLYQLTIEPGTRFAKDRIAGAGEDAAADLYALTDAAMTDAGLLAYEISNYAIPGEEARHNVHVWRGGDYLGLGPGAHGRVFVPGGTGAVCSQPGHWEAHRRIPDPNRWIAEVANQGAGTAAREMLAAQDRAEEIIMSALRLREGLDEAALETETGLAIDRVVDAHAFDWLISDGFLVREDGCLRATAKGRLTLNAVTAKLLA